MRSLVSLMFVLFLQSPALAQTVKDSLAAKKPQVNLANPILSPISPASSLITPDQYTKSFGFFCKQELKMQKAHVPLTFRLGSMEQCNKLEQKPGYR